MSLDSFVGDGLNPSPYKEAVERAERAEAEAVRLRGALQEVRWSLHNKGRRPQECYEMSVIDAALAKGA